MLEEVYDRVKTAGEKLLGFAPKESIKKARGIYNDIKGTDDYSKAHLTRIFNDVTMVPSGMIEKSVKIEPIIEDEKRYNLIDAAYAIYKANVNDGKGKQFSFNLATSYMLARVEMEFLKIPIKGLSVERAIDQSRRNPLFFLLKNYFVWIIRMAAMGVTLHYTTKGNIMKGDFQVSPGGAVVLGFSFWVTFSVLFWNILLLFKVGMGRKNIQPRSTVK